MTNPLHEIAESFSAMDEVRAIAERRRNDERRLGELAVLCIAEIEPKIRANIGEVAGEQAFVMMEAMCLHGMANHFASGPNEPRRKGWRRAELLERLLDDHRNRVKLQKQIAHAAKMKNKAARSLLNEAGIAVD
jgi:hypothetical protein